VDSKARDCGIGSRTSDETVVQVKELDTFPATTMQGTSIQLSVRDELPEASYRDATEGVPHRAAKFKTKTFSTAIIEHQIGIDPGVLFGSEDPARTLEEESVPHMLAVMSRIVKQIWYGKDNNDPK